MLLQGAPPANKIWLLAHAESLDEPRPGENVTVVLFIADC